MKMWKTRDSLGEKWIEEVEVERITVSSVWVKGRRKPIRSTWEAYHVTWEVAHAYILGIAMSELDSAQHALDRARRKLEKVKAMKLNVVSTGAEGVRVEGTVMQQEGENG